VYLALAIGTGANGGALWNALNLVLPSRILNIQQARDEPILSSKSITMVRVSYAL